MSILSHLYFAPILGRLIRANVPELIDGGAVDSDQLAKQAGLHPLSTVLALRALTALGVFRELAPGTFANSEASSLFRDGGGLRNYTLFATSEQFLKSAMALGHSFSQEGVSPCGLVLQSRVADLFDLLPAFRLHDVWAVCDCTSRPAIDGHQEQAD